MSEVNALAQKIAVLSAREPVDKTGARVISEGGSPPPLAAILREVGDTVLERCLAFHCDTTTMHIIAAGRRMRGILGVSPTADASVIGQVLSREEPALVQAAYDLLAAHFGPTATVSVRSLPAEPFGKGGERGISTDELAALWDVAATSATVSAKAPMDAFLSANAAIFSSSLHIHKGEIIATSGDVAALETVWNTQVSAFRETYNKTLHGDADPQLISLKGVFDDGTSAALAFYEDHVALMVCGADSFAAMQASWQRVFA